MRVSEVMIKDVKTISNQFLVSKALSLMQKEHVKELPVMNGDKLAGLITMHTIVTYPSYPENFKVSKLMFTPPVVKENDDLFDALKAMKDSGVQGLPVVKGDLVVGFISDYDLLKVFKSDLKGLTVNDLMIESPPVLRESDNVARVKRLLHYEKVKSLPVVDDKNRLIGVIRDEDLLEFFRPHESMGKGVSGEGDSMSILNATIGSLMSKNYHSVIIGEKLISVADLMINNHLSSLIVVDESREPIGYIDRFELINYLYKEKKPRGVLLNFSGLKIDYLTNSMLTKVLIDHLNRINYLAKSISSIDVRIKGLHEGSGIRKFELNLKINLFSGIIHRVSKVGYALRECLDEALSDAEKVMKKEYKRVNP